MQQGSGIILIIVGLLVIYMVVTGKYPIFEEFFYKLFNLTPVKPMAVGTASGTTVPITSGASGVNKKRSAIQRAIDESQIGVTGGLTGKVGILN